MTTPDAAARARELFPHLEESLQDGCSAADAKDIAARIYATIAAALREAFEAGELSAAEKLNQPGAMRVNVLRGTIKLPDDLVWLHDTDGPVAKACAQARDAALREAAEWCEANRERNEKDAAEYAKRDISWAQQFDWARRRALTWAHAAAHFLSKIGAKP